MARAKLAVVVLAAGLGTRMRSARPKVLHPVAGRPLIGHVLREVALLRPDRVVAVIGPGMAAVEAARDAAPKVKITTAVQRDRRGTGHAVLQARRALSGFHGDILVLVGDAPLIRAETLRRLLSARHAEGGAAVAVLGMNLPDPGSYGRLIVSGSTLERIVEARDADEAERRVTLCNSGVLAVDSALLFELLAKLKPDNAKREYYLTDIVALATETGQRCAWTEAPAEELIAVNTRAELAAAEAAMQARLRAAAMDNGATFIDPASVWLSHDTVLGRDVTVGPSVIFGPGVRVADGVEIRAFCHIEGVRIGPGAIIGPFARLRPGADIGAGAHIGNFVEIKNARLGDGAKANHLAYIGDARVGAAANIGAGTITCNYDGVAKYQTDIGAEVFTGSNSTLVAPVRIGPRAYITAGSVITGNVPADGLAFGRARQSTLPGRAKTLRARLKRAATAKRKGR